MDRYSNWPIIKRAREGSKGLIDCLGHTFATLDTLALNLLPQPHANSWRSGVYTTVCHQWHFDTLITEQKLLWSPPNGPLLITPPPNGSLNTDSFQHAILHYQNTQLSPAQFVFGPPIRDLIPVQPGRYHPHPTLSDSLATREEALRNHPMKDAKRWLELTKRLPPLAVGNHVRVQNQTGPYHTKWDKWDTTGMVIQVRQFNQYVIHVDGSGRMTTRNRRFLRKYIPQCRPRHLNWQLMMTYDTLLSCLPDQPNKPAPVHH